MENADDAKRESAFKRFEESYQRAKAEVLAAAVHRDLSVDSAQSLLDALSAVRRMVEQVVKADRLLCSPGRAAIIESEAGFISGGSSDHPLHPHEPQI
jgi:hypothetical protein